MPRFFGRSALGALLFQLLMATGSAPVHAQAPQQDFLSGPRFGIGYAGVMPDALAGAGAWYMMGARRIGVFVNGKTTVPNLENHKNYCPAALTVPCTVASVQSEYNHPALRDENQWLILNAGGMYALTREFAIMVGGGLARLHQIREYVDAPEDEVETPPLTPEGNYFVPLGEQEWKPQITVSGLVRAGNRVAFSFGYETAPGGMTIGLYVVLP
jgi:hypothetical protein